MHAHGHAGRGELLDEVFRSRVLTGSAGVAAYASEPLEVALQVLGLHGCVQGLGQRHGASVHEIQGGAEPRAGLVRAF